MSNERFWKLPVVDAEGKLVKIMSEGNCLAHRFSDLYEVLRDDRKGHLGRGFQIALVVFAVLRLGLIAFNL